MITLARRPVKFNRHRDSSSHAGNHTKEKSQPDCIAKAKHNRVRHRSGEQSQRPMFAAQQIVSKVQRSEHVEARRRDAYAGQQMMIDGMREMHAMIVEGSYFNFKASFLAYLFFS